MTRAEFRKMSLAALFWTYWSAKRRYFVQHAKRTNAHNIQWLTSPQRWWSIALILRSSKQHYTTNGGDLLLEREGRIKRNVYVANCIGKTDVRAFKINGLRNSQN